MTCRPVPGDRAVSVALLLLLSPAFVVAAIALLVERSGPVRGSPGEECRQQSGAQGHYRTEHWQQRKPQHQQNGGGARAEAAP